MNLYLDASALVKRYIAETGSAEINALIAMPNQSAWRSLAAPVSATFAKLVQMQTLQHKAALALLQDFRNDRQDWIRFPLIEILVALADTLAWEHGLRGYDAVHPAAALVWQEALSEPVTLATFDEQLWRAAEREGLVPFPVDLPSRAKTRE